MSRLHFKSITLAASLLVLCLGVVHPAFAQFRGGGGGGGGGFGGFGGGGFGGGGGRGGSTGAGTRQYNNNTMIGDATFSVDTESRRVIVITDEETSKAVAQVITNLDRPRPQVLIKVVFMEVQHTDGTDIGLEGGFSKTLSAKDSTVAGGANVFGMNGLSGITNINPLLPQGNNGFYQPASAMPAPGAGVYQMLGQDYQATLRAIAQSGRAKVLSRPSILARNNQPATIMIGQNVPIISSVSYSALNGTPINAYSYQEVGIILRVTPFITKDGMVEMMVSPEISSVSASQSAPLGNGASTPYIDRRAADTVVVTPDRQTVVIGGLMQTQKTVSESKIPLLGDIPGLGILFKHKVTSDQKTELIIFLTPYIVEAPTQLAALSTKERNNSPGISEFKEEELKRMLDTVPDKQREPKDANSKTAPATEKKKSSADKW